MPDSENVVIGGELLKRVKHYAEVREISIEDALAELCGKGIDNALLLDGLAGKEKVTTGSLRILRGSIKSDEGY